MTATATESAAQDKNASRTEKKARLALDRMGLKAISGITRVVLRRTGNMMFVVSKPDVFRMGFTDNYIVFGEAKVENLMPLSDIEQAAEENMPQLEESEETEQEVDATGIEEKDISLVMEQANVSRPKAVQALKENENDIVNAIMALST